MYRRNLSPDGGRLVPMASTSTMELGSGVARWTKLSVPAQYIRPFEIHFAPLLFFLLFLWLFPTHLSSFPFSSLMVIRPNLINPLTPLTYLLSKHTVIDQGDEQIAYSLVINWISWYYPRQRCETHPVTQRCSWCDAIPSVIIALVLNPKTDTYNIFETILEAPSALSLQPYSQYYFRVSHSCTHREAA